MLDELLEIQKEMLATIEYVDEYSWKKGTLGGLSWGMDCFNDAFDGLQPGLILVAAGPNTGKSALCLQLAWKIAHANKEINEEHTEKAYVLYFSLDDNATEILPRVIAMDQSIPISVVKSPKKHEEMGHAKLLERRQIGIEKLKENVDCFKVIDGTYGNSVEFIENTIVKHLTELRQNTEEKYKLVVFIDNFHDLTVETRLNSNNDQEKWIYVSEQLSRLCTIYDMPIICTAELRKLNGARRPMMDDVRESGKIAYEAKAILTCYNEVGIKGEGSNVYWQDDDRENPTEKLPILEVRVAKNKYSNFKRRLYFRFLPEYSQLGDVEKYRSDMFDQMILS